MRKKIALILLVIGALFLFYAQGSALTAPKWIILNNQGQFTVENQTENPAKVQVTAADWRFNDKGRVEAGNYGSLSYSLPFDFYPREFKLAPGEEKQITIEPHEGSIPQKARSSLLIVEEIGVKNEQIQVGFAKYVRIFRFPAEHNRKREASITNVELADENTFKVSVKNTGNMPMKITEKKKSRVRDEEKTMSFMRINNELGEIVKEKSIAPFALMPGVAEPVTIEANLEPGDYNLLAVFDYDGKRPVGTEILFEVDKKETISIKEIRG